jgi:lactoylglutathione lyase
VVGGPRTTGDGYYESCIVGFEGNQIELTVWYKFIYNYT